MAVLESVPGLKVTIEMESNGNLDPMKEYDRPANKKNTSSTTQRHSEETSLSKTSEKFVMSEVPNSYSIKIEVAQNYVHSQHDILARIIVDGKPVYNKTMNKRYFPIKVSIHGGFVRRQSIADANDHGEGNGDPASDGPSIQNQNQKQSRGKTRFRKFQFAEIEFVGENLFGNSDWTPEKRMDMNPDPALLGTIIVVMHKVDITGTYPIDDRYGKGWGQRAFENGKVDKNQACVDGPKSHRTLFGKDAPKWRAMRFGYRSNHVEKDRRPIGVFKFHYRSKENLVAMGILQEDGSVVEGIPRITLISDGDEAIECSEMTNGPGENGVF